MKHGPAPIQAVFSSKNDPTEDVSRLVDRVARAYKLPEGVETDLRIALDEVVTNIVKYAYTDAASHEFTIRCALLDGCLETTIEDDGIAFDPLDAPPPDLNVPMEERRVGGLGVHFVKKLMSGVSYQRVGTRNRLTLQQRITKEGIA